MPSIFNIPSGEPFPLYLAKGFLERYGSSGGKDSRVISDSLILLPTRRGCRAFEEALTRESSNFYGRNAFILPRIQAIGDVDEAELAFNYEAHLPSELLVNLPPALSRNRRKFLLAKLIMARQDFEQGLDRALMLAEALGHFMDQVYTEQLSWEALTTIVPEKFASHWQLTLKFLEIITQQWPCILAEQGVIDYADRRLKLLVILKNYWQGSPPESPIVAAGSTGSIPAVRELLALISELPQGHLVLPGLDYEPDGNNDVSLPETHPQHNMKKLLGMISPDALASVSPWYEPGKAHDVKYSAAKTARRILANEVMRPSESVSSWHDFSDRQLLQNAFAGLAYCECADEQEEAAVIAVSVKNAIEENVRSIVIIAPDRNTYRRVSELCERWNLRVDHSAGEAFAKTTSGVFLLSILDVILSGYSPLQVMNLLNNPMTLKFSAEQKLLIEQAIRGFKTVQGLQGILYKFSSHENCEALISIGDDLFDCFKSFMVFSNTDAVYAKYDPGFLLKAHIEVASLLHDATEASASMAEGADIGQPHLVEIYKELYSDLSVLGTLTLKEYADTLRSVFESKVIRPPQSDGFDIRILGQLEARMIDADFVIMSALNEGSWPIAAGHDPWLSHSMRQDFGLPIHDAKVGLAAHDFVQGFCASKVLMTRTLKKGGVPQVASRWIQRLSAFLKTIGHDISELQHSPYLDWARHLDHVQTCAPAKRPAPTPPVNKRPQKIYASGIETWLKDPYSVYAKYTLRLKAADELEQDLDAAFRGTAVHNIFEYFIKETKTSLPSNPKEYFDKIMKDYMSENPIGQGLGYYWLSRFETLADEFIAHETKWREGAKPYAFEVYGEAAIQTSAGTFKIRAYADRIDRLQGGYALIDYKTGGTFTQKALKSGELPQLAAEALIAEEGGYEEIPRGPIKYIGYWIVSVGSAEAFKEISVKDEDVAISISATKEGLIKLFEKFSEREMPYYSVPDPDNPPRFNDYAHLARFKEWRYAA